MKLQLIVLSCLFAAARPAAFSQASDGGIQGAVTDDTDSAIPGIYVVATPIGQGGGLTLTAITDAAGRFAISKAKPAKYILCVQSPGGPYLDPCRWGKPVETTVIAGSVAAAGALSVSRGSTLRVRDPAGKRLGAAAAPGTPGMTLGVMTASSMFYALNRTLAHEAEMRFETTIPFDTPLRLAVYGGPFELADEKGKGLQPGANIIPVRHGSSDMNPEVSLTVTGRK